MSETERQKHILLIEDSPTQARYAGLLLEDAGYRVSVAPTGHSGVEKAESELPDLIMLDVVLPDLDGFSVCRRLRHRLLHYVPIMMLTEQRTAIEDKLDGLSVGADDYLNKPYDEREMLARVASLLRIKQVIDELHSRLANEHQSYQALKRIALVDQLTGLYNRHYFNEVLAREFSVALRYGNPLACIMTDIDHFRDFNDSHGHPAGDWVLQNTAGLVREMLRHGDVIARYGGEEFVMVLPMTGSSNAAELSERTRAAVAAASWHHPEFGVLGITLSMGVAALPMRGVKNPQELLSYADQALYRAKSNGRNRVEVFVSQE
ncbi:MAG: diguanylate cyclase [Candidatus Competibacteraceae bacterium]|nr:diguanylate cyclase [Candidatus Competibacteraceae bacterium]MBK8752838.1 diguanylate cyclase [Candidatus Competibacteraceae bacterium]